VSMHLRKERFSKSAYNKLKMKKIGPCKILKRISNNAYVLKLPKGLDISPTFNVSNLFELHEGMVDEVE
jgi:hypothetical protein